MTWLRAVFGFRMRPAAHTATYAGPELLPSRYARRPPQNAGKGRLLVLLAQCSEFNALFRVSLPPAVASCSVALRVPLVTCRRQTATAQDQTRLPRQSFAKFHTGGVNAGGGGIRAPLSPEPAETGKLESPR